MPNKLLKSDCGKLSPCLQKDANKPPIHHNRLARRYAKKRNETLKYLVLIISLLFVQSLYADIYKCKGKNKVEYFTDYRCKSSEESKLVNLNDPNIVQNALSKEGYELFLEGKRIGFEPEWTLEKSIEHFRWYKSKNNRTNKSKAYFNGVLLFVPED